MVGTSAVTPRCEEGGSSHPFIRPKAFHPWSIGETCLSDERFDLKGYTRVAVSVLSEPGFALQGKDK